MKKPELVGPAGNWPMLVAAVEAGADSIYFGVKELNMRTAAQNFETSEIKKVADYCHKNKVKAYLALNTIVYEDELEKIKKIINDAKKAKVDAVICWDFSIIKEAKKLKVPVHLSTQASVSNSESAEFFYKQGVKRIVLARECSIGDIKKIKQKIPKLEIECFVHGAMCVSISGRCFLSQDMFRKSANRGDCMQPCRRSYKVINEETGKEIRVGNNYILSPKDLCAIGFIDKLINAGVDAFKIEGRNRSPEYAQITTEVYKEAIKSYKKLNNKKINELIKKLKTVYNRGFSSGFYLGMPTNDDFTDADGSKASEIKEYIGYVKNFYKKINVAEIKIENAYLKSGDEIRFIGNKTGTFRQKISSMEINHKKVKKAEKQQSVAIKIIKDKIVRENDKVFLIRKLDR